MSRSKPDEVPEMMDAAPGDAQVTIVSTWRDLEPSMSNASMMTMPMAMGHASVQTTEREDEGTQTEDAPQAGAPSKKTAGLNKFVDRAAVLMEEEFQRVQQEHEMLEPLNRGMEEEQEPANCIFELTPFGTANSFAAGGTGTGESHESSSGARQGGNPLSMAATPATTGGPHSKLVVTCLSWSSTGQTIAASYGRWDIAGWCTDRGALVTWNLGRESIKQHKPDVMVDVDVCLMSCAFHPEHPALIAGGTFNGDLYVWDLSQEGDLQRGRSDVLCEVRHQEPICSITWQYSLTEAGKYGNKAQAYRLITLGADGRVLVWVWHKLDMPLYGYQLLWPAPGLDRKILWGGTCMSFARDTNAAGSRTASSVSKSEGGAATGMGVGNSTFVIGTEGGRIFRCYYDLNDLAVKDFQKALSTGDKLELRCPIKEASYQAHAGAVYGLDCSPFQRDVFMTAGADGTIRLYHALQQQPLMVLEPANAKLFGAAWSPARPLVFAAAAGDGQVYMYDLLRAQDIVRPVLALDASPGGGPVYAMAFNSRKPEFFATGDSTSIQIWRLPDNLAASRKGEAALLRKLVAADDVSEALRDLARKGRL